MISRVGRENCYLMSANRKSANFLVRKFANLYYLSANYKPPTFYKILPDSVSKQSLKSSLYSIFYDVQLIKALYALFVRGKVCSCGLVEVLSSQITKRWVPQSANPQIGLFALVRKPNKLFRSANFRWLHDLPSPSKGGECDSVDCT